MHLFESVAYAMPFSGTEGGGGAMFQLIPFVLIFVIFWFLVIRPQQKRAKALRDLLAALNKGDEVKTDSGIHGTIVRLGEDAVTLEIAHKVEIRIDRARIAERVTAKKEAKSKGDEAESKSE
jgi:preprotein translocase subunit YajC